MLRKGASHHFVGHHDGHKNNFGWTPLHLASFHGNDECVRSLLNTGAQINAKNNIGCTPLHYASNSGYSDCIRILLDSGADFTLNDSDGKTPFDIAKNNCKDVITKWIQDNEEPIKEPDSL